MSSQFEEEIRSAINRASKENDSNTPDYILSEFLLTCLDAFNEATQRRETYYGRDPRPTKVELK